VVGGSAKFRWEADPDPNSETGGPLLHGAGATRRNSFLTSPRDYGDFLLEVDVKIEKQGGNSGIQLRSHDKDGQLVGYQIEIDPSDRKWSGGLYDEGRRGWLDSLEDNVDAQEAFAPGEWNTYRILCIGPRIRTWVNDIPAANHLDMMDLSGRIGFQVHSGLCDVMWRNARIADLGIRKWKPVLEQPVDVDPEGMNVWFDDLVPRGTSVLSIRALIRSGVMHVVLGNPNDSQRQAYALRIPAPLGDPEKGTPGVVQFVLEPDSTRVLVDGAPLVPGPPALTTPLDIDIRFQAGASARIEAIELLLPSPEEIAAIEKPSAAEKAGAEEAEPLPES
jgi:hypothetical protein